MPCRRVSEHRRRSIERAWRLHAWGDDPVLEPVPHIPPGPGEVLVAVEACGIGRTVLNAANGQLADDPALLPRTPGHELVGRVVEVGDGVDDSAVGRRVVAYFYLFCGACVECLSGREPRCRRLAGWLGVHRDGGYRPTAAIPARNAIDIPAGLGAVAATVVPDAVATPVHVAGRAAITAEDRVAVVGAAGGVGIHMIQVARLAGAAVAGLDVGEAKLATIDELGAAPHESGTIGDLDPAGLFPDGRPTVVVDFVGSDETLAWSAAAVGAGGRLVVLTTFSDPRLVLTAREMVLREISVLGSRYANRAEVRRAAELVAAGEVRPIVGRTVGPEDVIDVHRDLRSGRLIGRGALVWPGAAAQGPAP